MNNSEKDFDSFRLTNYFFDVTTIVCVNILHNFFCYNRLTSVNHSFHFIKFQNTRIVINLYFLFFFNKR